MINNRIAVQYLEWKLNAIDWFPSRIKRLPDDAVVGWYLVPFGWILGNFLREVLHPKDIVHQWRTHGIALMNAHGETFEDDEQFVEAMVYLIASSPDILAKVSAWMINKGYDPGEFDDIP